MDEQETTPNSLASSTLDIFFAAGFTVLGDSRDFSNNSVQVHLARGLERLVWSFPMQKSVVSVPLEGKTSLISIPVKDISFDVPMKKG